ncbi:MAG: hypothetical protein QXV93_03475 [Zestosphaera sp.]
MSIIFRSVISVPPQSIRVSRDELISYIRSYSSRVMPGLLNILNRIFITRYNSDIVSLFLSDPRKVYETLLSLYDNEDTVTLIMNYLLIKPMLIRLGRLDLTDRATMLAMKNPEGFKELLRSLDVDL